MGIKEKIPDSLVSISGKDEEIYKEDASRLLQGRLPGGWKWIPCSNSTLVATKKTPCPVYYKEFFPRNKYEGIKACCRGSRCQRARKQAEHLTAAGLSTPKILCWGKGKLNEFIIFKADEGQGFHSFLLKKYSPPLTPEKLLEKRLLLQQAGKIISLLHQKGLVHGDLRPDNLLVAKTDKGFKFSFLDNERNKHFERPPLSLIKKNLIQFSIIPDHLVTKADLMRFFQAYLSTDKNLSKQKQREFISDLFRRRHKRFTFILTRRNRHQRAENIKKVRNNHYSGECYHGSRISQILATETNPEAWFANNGILVKKDKTITSKIFSSMDCPPLFGKRFLPKNNLHFIKLLFRGEKACHLWQISHILLDLGIPVPKPAGYILTGRNPLRRNNYFFCASLPDSETLLAIARNKNDLSAWLAGNQLIERLARSLARMHNFGYSHGDAKWGNIMVNESNETFCWIDLDSVTKQKRRNNRWFYKDVARFSVDIIENKLGSKWLDLFLKSYAHTRCISATHLEKKTHTFIRKISKRHRKKFKVTQGIAQTWIKKLKHNSNSLFRKAHRPFVSEYILVLGDSHAIVFKQWQFILGFPKKHFSVCSVGGATASGLENPNSKTQTYKIFTKALQFRNYKKIIIMLGEVDTGFVIWYRAQKYGVEVAEMFMQTVTKYADFLSELSTKTDKIIVISTPLPTIKDGAEWGEVANLRKEVKTTKQERTKLTIKFNKAIERYCLHAGLVFINLDQKCLTKTGSLKADLKSKNPRDHHYDQHNYSLLLIKSLRDIV